jgi:hypothetical protein
MCCHPPESDDPCTEKLCLDRSGNSGCDYETRHNIDLLDGASQ